MPHEFVMDTREWVKAMSLHVCRHFFAHVSWTTVNLCHNTLQGEVLSIRTEGNHVFLEVIEESFCIHSSFVAHANSGETSSACLVPMSTCHTLDAFPSAAIQSLFVGFCGQLALGMWWQGHSTCSGTSDKGALVT